MFYFGGESPQNPTSFNKQGVHTKTSAKKQPDFNHEPTNASTVQALYRKLNKFDDSSVGTYPRINQIAKKKFMKNDNKRENEMQLSWLLPLTRKHFRSAAPYCLQYNRYHIFPRVNTNSYVIAVELSPYTMIVKNYIFWRGFITI